MRGLHAVCRECVVTKRTSFTAPDGKVVYQMQVQGFAMNHSFTGDAQEAAAWPPLGAEVHLEASLEPLKGGGFKLGIPVFRPLEPVKQKTGAA